MNQLLLRTGFLALCMGFTGLSACGQLAPPSAPAAVRQQAVLGKDGDATVSTPNTLINRYAALGLDGPAGTTVLTLSNAAGRDLDALQPITVEDLVLIIQMQGAETDPTNAVSFG